MEKVDIIVEAFEPGVRDPASGLMQVFGIDQATAVVIVQRVPVTVKRGVTLDAAQPFEQALIKLGARVRLVRHGEPPPPPRPVGHETSLDGTPVSPRRGARVETALMHGAGWEQPVEPADVQKVSLPAFRAVRPNTPPPIDMSLPPPPPAPPASLRDPNERVVLRSEAPPPPSFLTPDPMARASKPPEAPRSIAPAHLFEAPPAPSIDLADDLPEDSQRSGQWHATRSPLSFDATSCTTAFADDLMLPWVGTTPELPRPTTPTRRKNTDRR